MANMYIDVLDKANKACAHGRGGHSLLPARRPNLGWRISSRDESRASLAIQAF